MPQPRFRDTGETSFFGSLVYDRVIPPDHFLRKLNALLDWQALTRPWLEAYKGGAEYGRPPFDPAVVLKMLLLSYLYDLSERQTEDLVNYHLPAKWFVGLAVDEAAPDHATLTLFKNRLLAQQQESPLATLFEQVVRQAQQAGISFGRVQVVDSVHTVADVNVEEDDHRRGSGRPRRDPAARWGTKGSRSRVTGEGTRERHRETFLGYKAHVSLNAENEFITSLVVTTGEAYDGHQLPALVARDAALGLPVHVYAGDRGYDDGENHALLTAKGLKSALRLNAYRTQKKNGNKAPWLRLLRDRDYQAGLAVRYKVEQKFGEAKRCHGLRRCRYLGLARYRLQAYLTATVLNLKRLVKLLFGVGFRESALA